MLFNKLCFCRITDQQNSKHGSHIFVWNVLFKTKYISDNTICVVCIMNRMCSTYYGYNLFLISDSFIHNKLTGANECVWVMHLLSSRVVVLRFFYTTLHDNTALVTFLGEGLICILISASSEHIYSTVPGQSTYNFNGCGVAL